MIDEELKSLLEAMRQENADTRRHFDVANEATRHEIRFVAEAVAQVNEKLDRTAQRSIKRSNAQPPRLRR